MAETEPDDGNYFYVTRRDDGVLEVRARAEDAETGMIGHINRDIPPGDPEYDEYDEYVGQGPWQ